MIWQNRLLILLVIGVMVMGFYGCSEKEKPAATQFVTAEGSQFMTPEGEPFTIKGTNLGNWLLPEGYIKALDLKFMPADA